MKYTPMELLEANPLTLLSLLAILASMRPASSVTSSDIDTSIANGTNAPFVSSALLDMPNIVALSAGVTHPCLRARRHLVPVPLNLVGPAVFPLLAI